MVDKFKGKVACTDCEFYCGYSTPLCGYTYRSYDDDCFVWDPIRGKILKEGLRVCTLKNKDGDCKDFKKREEEKIEPVKTGWFKRIFDRGEEG